MSLTDLSRAERQWQRRALFLKKRRRTGGWIAVLLLVAGLCAASLYILDHEYHWGVVAASPESAPADGAVVSTVLRVLPEEKERSSGL